VPIVRLLLEAGANPHAKSPLRGQTPLDFARRRGHEEIVRMLESRKATGKTPQASAALSILGIEVQDSVPLGRGARIKIIYQGAPAWKAGLLHGDIITEFNGNRIRNREDLKRSVEAFSGMKAGVNVLRHGLTLNFVVFNH